MSSAEEPRSPSPEPSGSSEAPDFWARLCQETGADAAAAAWGVLPMWSAEHPDDATPITHQENKR